MNTNITDVRDADRLDFRMLVGRIKTALLLCGTRPKKDSDNPLESLLFDATSALDARTMQRLNPKQYVSAIDMIVRDCCESDRDDPEDERSIVIFDSELRNILINHLIDEPNERRDEQIRNARLANANAGNAEDGPEIERMVQEREASINNAAQPVRKPAVAPYINCANPECANTFGGYVYGKWPKVCPDCQDKGIHAPAAQPSNALSGKLREYADTLERRYPLADGNLMSPCMREAADALEAMSAGRLTE